MSASNLPLVLLGLAALGFAALAGSVFTVHQTRQVLVTQFGEVRQKITEPGLHFKLPIIQDIMAFDNRVLSVDPPAEEVLLADQKRVVVDTFARYRITDMLKYFQTLGVETAASQRMNNIISASLRSVLGGASLADVLSAKRSELMGKIRAQVNVETARFGIDLVDVRIVRADLPEQTSQSIYARMRAEREREAKDARAKGQEMAQEIRSKADKERTILMAEAERDAQTLRGEGDGQAIKIYADAFGKDPAFYEFYRTMEAYRKSLSNPETMLLLSPDSAFLRYLDKARPSPAAVAPAAGP
jgi:membrane protease subunit HflC